jgi:hypothetical protein
MNLVSMVLRHQCKATRLYCAPAGVDRQKEKSPLAETSRPQELSFQAYREEPPTSSWQTPERVSMVAVYKVSPDHALPV